MNVWCFRTQQRSNAFRSVSPISCSESHSMKKLALALAVIGLLAVGQGAQAVIATVDDVPAATLLLPYFEVDLANENGVNTLFSINNASATAILAHVVLWTDLSVPTFDFNIYLTGYDVQTISIRDIFHGIVPRTASDGQDPTDTISPQGTFSQDINFASCTGQLPPPWRRRPSRRTSRPRTPVDSPPFSAAAPAGTW